MISRRAFLSGLAGGLLVIPTTSEAQQPSRILGGSTGATCYLCSARRMVIPSAFPCSLASSSTSLWTSSHCRRYDPGVACGKRRHEPHPYRRVWSPVSHGPAVTSPAYPPWPASTSARCCRFSARVHPELIASPAARVTAGWYAGQHAMMLIKLPASLRFRGPRARSGEPSSTSA